MLFSTIPRCNSILFAPHTKKHRRRPEPGCDRISLSMGISLLCAFKKRDTHDPHYSPEIKLTSPRYIPKILSIIPGANCDRFQRAGTPSRFGCCMVLAQSRSWRGSDRLPHSSTATHNQQQKTPVKATEVMFEKPNCR